MDLLLVWKGQGRELPNRARLVVIIMTKSLKLNTIFQPPSKAEISDRMLD